MDSPTDVFIAVMGVTGAGKSTFISKCCKKRIAIGHNLQACTSTVDVYPCKISGSTTVYLVDTPGFDDTNRSDTEVLREIATWLTDSYAAEVKLNGIIYLHRISDVRMQGSAKKNLFMFKKLCGPNALKNVILATTMWDSVREADGAARESELISTPGFWGWMVSQGSKVYRHSGSTRSAFGLIQTLMQDNARITLDLQQQMVNEKKDLDDTDAGKEVQAEIIKERKKFEKMFAEVQQQKEEALYDQDKESARAMAELQEEYNYRIAQLENSSKNLKTNMERLLKDKYQKLEAKMKEQEARHEKEVRRLERERQRQESKLIREKEVARKQTKEARHREREVLEGLQRLQIKNTRHD
ncbi:P-loop containing nucleoside triphosphate hydrolase protein [Mytilinidion resinicola]|uniref:P-loop containing nucleoside triphosphate hydrolase protein n=1 Tax=Mytilinidion resinicola TaxID=574789 RepID=A0A6A6YF24_9PEZI|nr:P-loop containing nucleoside triphosphate hydrolase protein [Mytilinidion resinicola]KAF2807133.1 P-loop containing nucleoside triphosphate hydrolase protein [Mytilinidion resinicola]